MDGGGASRTTKPAAGDSQATDVSIREYLGAAIAYERRITLYLFLGLTGLGAFAWSEIQRRLGILNHENARLLAQQEKTVSQDTYAANEQQRAAEQAEFKDWQKAVDRDRTQSISREEFTRDTHTESRAKISTTAAIVGAVVSVVVIGLAVLNYQALHRSPTTTTPLKVIVTVPSP